MLLIKLSEPVYFLFKESHLTHHYSIYNNMLLVNTIYSNFSSGVTSNSNSINRWYPQETLRRTNWLHCVDRLRNHDTQK